MRITTKGQVTIPQEIREELGLLPHTEVTFDIVDGEARLRKARSSKLSRGDGVIGHLRSVRPSNKLTTAEIMALMRGQTVTTLVDTNVLLDVITHDKEWASWSEAALRKAAERSTLAINPIIFAEVSMKFARIEDAEAALVDFAREPLPYEAGFLTGRAFLAYRKRGGVKRSPIPDFYVGAHAIVRRMDLLTRDAARYRTYFPGLTIIAP